jgi:cytochrome c oxidase subunit II
MKRIASLAFLSAFLSAQAAHAEGPIERAIYFQGAASPVMERIIDLHNMLMWIMSGIVLLVLALLVVVIVRFNAKAHPEPSKTTHNVPLEIVWTLAPVLILLIIAVPSFRVLFYGAITQEADMTIKAIGNQWNWSYEYPDHGDISFTAVMTKNTALKPDDVPLLTTDNPVVLPVGKNVRIQVTASDVIHSFAVPAFGIKTDAVPGRLNETWVRIDKPGTYYGQCSELCGKDHAFMPIEVRAVPEAEFAEWVVAQGGRMPAPEDAKVPAADATPGQLTPESKDAVTRQSEESAKTNGAAEVPIQDSPKAAQENATDVDKDNVQPPPEKIEYDNQPGVLVPAKDVKLKD